MERALCPALYRKINTPIGDRGQTDCNSTYRRLSATYHSVYLGPLSFSNTPFLAILLPLIDAEVVTTILHTVSDFPALFKILSKTHCGRLLPTRMMFRFSGRFLCCSGELWIMGFIVFIKLGRLYHYRKHSVFMTLWNVLQGFDLH